jgi:hypothetical protein
MLPIPSECDLLVPLVVLHLSTAPSRVILHVNGKLKNCADVGDEYSGGKYSVPYERFLISCYNLFTFSVLAEKDGLSTTI